MSDVKRFNPVDPPDTQEGVPYQVAEESDHGIFVYYDDYAALEARAVKAEGEATAWHLELRTLRTAIGGK